MAFFFSFVLLFLFFFLWNRAYGFLFVCFYISFSLFSFIIFIFWLRNLFFLFLWNQTIVFLLFLCCVGSLSLSFWSRLLPPTPFFSFSFFPFIPGIFNKQIKQHLNEGPKTPQCHKGGTLQRMDVWETAVKTQQQNSHSIHQKHFIKCQAMDTVWRFFNLVLLRGARSRTTCKRYNIQITYKR